MYYKDKILHFGINFFIVIITSYWIGLFTSVIFALITSVSKELIDKFIRKTFFSWADIIADIFGILTGIIIINYIK